ncbi:uncharacterized protein LOC142760678 [Rhinoderma darwinii]|uniref:uncharacterized protein LOC142760678 n=1 Tax=Rhinoderma darwinii TaxID=43563 RepID=UPI003F674D75
MLQHRPPHSWIHLPEVQLRSPWLGGGDVTLMEVDDQVIMGAGAAIIRCVHGCSDLLRLPLEVDPPLQFLRRRRGPLVELRHGGPTADARPLGTIHRRRAVNSLRSRQRSLLKGYPRESWGRLHSVATISRNASRKWGLFGALPCGRAALGNGLITWIMWSARQEAEPHMVIGGRGLSLLGTDCQVILTSSEVKREGERMLPSEGAFRATTLQPPWRMERSPSSSIKIVLKKFWTWN